MTATEYTIRINGNEGLLEVSGPDKDWVDAKIEQLSSSISAPGDQPGGRKRTRSARKSAQTDGTEAAQDGAHTPARRSRGGAGGRSEINEELRELLTAEVKGQFKEYIGARRKAWNGSQSAQAAIVATFLHDELDIPGVDPNDLYTVYTIMGERSPRNLRSQLTNARQRGRYFSGLSNGKMVLSHAGENFARFDSLDSNDSDDES